MKRVILIVIDSLGVGAAKDCHLYGDTSKCNTLCNVAKKVNGLSLPNLEKLGLGNITEIEGVRTVETPLAKYGIMTPNSPGKDTTTGHWEIAGVILDEAFKTYPNGFDDVLINEFIEKTGCKGILGNYPASGTKIIEDLYKQHQDTKFPIVYTSADSVFQVAVDIDVIPLETLYNWCEVAREILNNGYNVSRVIARPFQMVDGKPTRISKYRKDYSLAPFSDTVLNAIKNKNGMVFAIGKIEDIFVQSGVTHSVHTGSNKEGLNFTLSAVRNEIDYSELKIEDAEENVFDKSLVFTNLVDTDMLFGHRNDYVGYGKALEEIDLYLGKIIPSLSEEDLLIITADHGCDPTVEGTDHTRENVPLLIYNKNINAENLGKISGFSFVAEEIKKWLRLS